MVCGRKFEIASKKLISELSVRHSSAVKCWNEGKKINWLSYKAE